MNTININSFSIHSNGSWRPHGIERNISDWTENPTATTWAKKTIPLDYRISSESRNLGDRKQKRLTRQKLAAIMVPDSIRIGPMSMEFEVTAMDVKSLSWDRMEERRGQLIKKEVYDGGLNSEEIVELDCLQSVTSQRERILFPRSDKKIRELEEFARNLKATK